MACLSRNQSVQHDYTTVLACLVKTFPSKKEFRDLVQLTDYNDLESDFFEHMKHIQVTRTLFHISMLEFFYELLSHVFSPVRSTVEVVP